MKLTKKKIDISFSAHIDESGYLVIEMTPQGCEMDYMVLTKDQISYPLFDPTAAILGIDLSNSLDEYLKVPIIGYYYERYSTSGELGGPQHVEVEYTVEFRKAESLSGDDLSIVVLLNGIEADWFNLYDDHPLGINESYISLYGIRNDTFEAYLEVPEIRQIYQNARI